MFEDPAKYPFAAYLEANFETIREEVERIDFEAFSKWSQDDGYSGDWSIYAIYHRDPEWHYAADCRRNAPDCPQTLRVASRIHGLMMIGLSLLRAGSHIHPHTDGDPDVLRTHMGLFVPPNCGIRVEQEKRPWERGKTLMFRGDQEHEAANFSDQTRVVLICDVDLTNPRVIDPPEDGAARIGPEWIFPAERAKPSGPRPAGAPERRQPQG